MALDSVLLKFVTAADSSESIRLFVEHAELRGAAAQALLEKWMAAVRASNRPDAEALIRHRATLLSQLQTAAADAAGAPLETLREHPLLREHFAREAQRGALPPEVNRAMKYVLSARSRVAVATDERDHAVERGVREGQGLGLQVREHGPDARVVQDLVVQ